MILQKSVQFKACFLSKMHRLRCKNLLQQSFQTIVWDRSTLNFLRLRKSLCCLCTWSSLLNAIDSLISLCTSSCPVATELTHQTSNFLKSKALLRSLLLALSPWVNLESFSLSYLTCTATAGRKFQKVDKHRWLSALRLNQIQSEILNSSRIDKTFSSNAWQTYASQHTKISWKILLQKWKAKKKLIS